MILENKESAYCFCFEFNVENKRGTIGYDLALTYFFFFSSYKNLWFPFGSVNLCCGGNTVIIWAADFESSSRYFHLIYLFI